MNRLVVLGSKGGPALRPNGARPTSTLLQLNGVNILVDAGLGCSLGLVTAGVALQDLDVIVITHLHADHVLELGPLLHTAWTSGLSHPIRVLAPTGAVELWAAFLQSMSYDINVRIDDEGRTPLKELVNVDILQDGVSTELPNSLTVQTFTVPHPPVEPNFALRFTASELSVTFSGDTGYHPPLAEFARGSDLLIHEAMIPESLERLVARTHAGAKLLRHLRNSHSSVEEAAQIAAAAQVRTLILHHLIPADDPLVNRTEFEQRARRHFNGRIIAAHDGMSIDLTTLGA
jgi:ribonuclease BN (tRNA processing enzyme)